MRILLTIGFILLALIGYSQPVGYVNGTFVNWSFRSKDHGFFQAANKPAEKKYLDVINFTGTGQVNFSGGNGNAPEKWFVDGGTNWNGKFLVDGDTVYIRMLTIYNNFGAWAPEAAADIEYYFANCAGMDSSDNGVNYITGLSIGAAYVLQELTNNQSHNSPYRFSFRGSILLTPCSYGQDITAGTENMRHWVWIGALDGTCTEAAGNGIFLDLGGDKQKTIQANGGHNSTTWDSCWARPHANSTAETNRWVWMWDEGAGIDSTIQKIPIGREDHVDWSTAGGRIADSTHKKFDGASDPHWGVEIPGETIETSVITAHDTYGSYNQSRIIDVWFKKRYKNFKIYVLIPNAGGTDSTEFFLRDAFRTFKGGKNGYDWVSYYNRDTAAAEYQPDARFTHTPFQTPGYYLVAEFTDTVQGVTICETLSGTKQSAISRYYFYGTEIAGEETTWVKKTEAQVIAMDTLPNEPYTSGTNLQNFADRLTQTNVDWSRHFVFGGSTPLVKLGVGGVDSMVINANNIDYLQDIKGANPGSKIYPAFNGGMWGDGVRPVNDSAGLSVNNMLMKGNRREHYSRFANDMAILYATYGNDATDRNNKFTGGAEQYGLGIYDAWDYNEPNGSHNGNFFMLPIHIASMFIEVARAIKAVDSTQIVMLPSLAGADMESIRGTERLLTFFWGDSVYYYLEMIGIHAYHINNKKPYTANLNERVFNSKIIAPLSTDPSLDRTYMQDYVRYRRQSAQELGRFLPFSINEFGADKQDGDVHYVHGPSSNGQFDTSLYNIKPFDGYNRFKSQGIYAIQASLTAFEVGIHNMAWYWHQDVDTVTVKISYLNSGMSRPEFISRQFANWEFPDTVKVYAGHFMYYGLAKRLNGWYPEKTAIDTTAGVRHVWKWKKTGSPDSSLIILFYPNHDNGTANYTATAVSTGAQYWIPKMTDSVNDDFNVNGTTSAATVSSNQVNMTADALPVFLFYTEATGNAPPLADAGTDITIHLPTNSVTVSGTGSSDPDGTIDVYAWTKISGPATFTIVSPSSATTDITGLVEGTYVFRLTVTDNDAATDTDDITVTVDPADNVAPTAAAGSDQTITLPTSSVTLNGSSSSDPDGTIATYLWEKLSGTGGTIVNANSATTNVTGLSAGTYVFRLTVTDNDDATDTDEITITVNANPAPVADAGPDQLNINVSSTTVSGSGSTDNGTIVSYFWEKVSGPTDHHIVSPTSVTTVIENLTAGTYVFRLTVTDNGGLTDTDEVTINVANPIQIRRRIKIKPG
jgi:hypothetical protein